MAFKKKNNNSVFIQLCIITKKGWHITETTKICFSVCVHIWFRSFASACCFSPSLQDRLLYLDIAEDFVAKAKRFYPPKDDSDEETPGLSVNLPLLLARIGAMNGGGEDEEEQSEKDDENLSD